MQKADFEIKIKVWCIDNYNRYFVNSLFKRDQIQIFVRKK